MPTFTVIRKHEINAGHRVYAHEGQCSQLHGHSYRFHFHCVSHTLNDLGMVVDFSVIKHTLCRWLDEHYDHRMLIWEHDPLAKPLQILDPSVVLVPYNPTAENMAHYLLTIVAPQLLADKNLSLTKVTVAESNKSRASCEL